MKTKPATKAQKDRMKKIKMIGCVICGSAPCHAHHLLSGSVRRGHEFTIGLCPHHHETRIDKTKDQSDPSYHGAKRNFNSLYGTDDDLLAKQDEILGYFP